MTAFSVGSSTLASSATFESPAAPFNVQAKAAFGSGFATAASPAHSVGPVVPAAFGSGYAPRVTLPPFNVQATAAFGSGFAGPGVPGVPPFNVQARAASAAGYAFPGVPASAAPPFSVTAKAAYGGGFAQPATLPVLFIAGGVDTVMRITSWDATFGDEGVSHLTLTMSPPPPAKPTTPSNLYLMQLLADLQSQVAGLATGGGAGGHVYATVVVAAHDSRSINADFVCAGFTDEQTLNLAISALPAGIGGKVLLLDGNYNTAAPILMNERNVILEGMGGVEDGYGSSINGLDSLGASDYDLIQISQRGCSVRSLALSSSADVLRAGRDISIIHLQGDSSTVTDYGIEGNTFLSGPSAGNPYSILSSGSSELGIIRHNTFLGNSLAGIKYVKTSVGNQGLVLIEGNTFNSTSSLIDFTAGGNDIGILGNYFVSTGGGIHLVRCTDVAISGNYSDGTIGAGGIGAPPCVWLDGCFVVAVTGNQFSAFPGHATGATPAGEGIAIRSTSHISEGIVIAGNNLDYNSAAISVVSTGHAIRSIVISGNSMAYDGPVASAGTGYAIWLSGSLVSDVTVVGNGIESPTTWTITRVPADGIHLDSGASYCHIADNTIRYLASGYYGASATAYAVNVADSACIGNFVHGNDCYQSSINDAGTGTVRYGNRTGVSNLDGPNGGSYATAIAFFMGG